ncbi:tubulin polymerization-promoting protein family member 2 [Strongylocentrotus purpuratus]|uniref:Tubulin polymerization-promoting protein family member 2 n=1 Tax=Strongylocentrotus purpuratus TaxID=7668 RepID=A0A7M7RGG1_STRPU|nr:tubulin polymerization-promoting protein family member 2 [Strongylocentrotus purpuratus]|eukprot:XP_011665864.1 PREDICTED: tubulin polymerization-promoting protein family member 2 [Strongylocentrotus purpuratus]
MSAQVSGNEKSLKGVFQKYAVFGRPGQTKDITSKNFSKMMKECDIMDKKVNQTEIDIIFQRAKASPKLKVLTYEKFLTSLKMIAKSKYGTDEEENFGKIKNQIRSSSGPSTAGTTSTSTTGKVDHFTDVTKYTGQHRERFEKDGTGKGKAGREYLVEESGYVTGYKGKDSFDGKE